MCGSFHGFFSTNKQYNEIKTFLLNSHIDRRLLQKKCTVFFNALLHLSLGLAENFDALRIQIICGINFCGLLNFSKIFVKAEHSVAQYFSEMNTFLPYSCTSNTPCLRYIFRKLSLAIYFHKNFTTILYVKIYRTDFLFLLKFLY